MSEPALKCPKCSADLLEYAITHRVTVYGLTIPEIAELKRNRRPDDALDAERFRFYFTHRGDERRPIVDYELHTLSEPQDESLNGWRTAIDAAIAKAKEQTK